MILNKEEIKSLIPHREPFLFLDRCDIIKIGFEGIGYRKFLNSEFYSAMEKHEEDLLLASNEICLFLKQVIEP